MESSFSEPPIPLRIGRYVDLRTLGRGGMGVVYSGYDPELDRAVAIKVMLHSTADFVARFRREAQAIARLTHGNVVQVFDFGVDEETNPYFVMELVAGTPLDKLISERGRLPVGQVVEIARQAAQGLSAAHRAGIIHRDVKPSNLIVDGRGNVKLVDFGIARSNAGAQLTQAASLMGTPGYMAPEQAQGKTVDSRADVYALGLTMFEMLTGEAPFYAEDPIALVVMNMQQPLPDLRQRGTFPPDLVKLVEQMAEKDPDARPQSCDAVARALEAIAVGAPADFGGPTGGMGASAADSSSPSVPPTNVYQVPAPPPPPSGSRVAIGVAAALATAGVGIAVVLLFGHKPDVVRPPVVVAHEEPKKVEPAAVIPDKKADAKTEEFAQKPVAHGPLRVAILKFQNISKDPALDAMADGIGETALNSMFGVAPGRLEIIERKELDSETTEIDRGADEHFDKATFAMKGKLVGVDVVLQGSYQRSGKLLRATARFVRVQTGTILDVVTTDGRARDALQLQDALAKALKQHVETVVALERPLALKGTSPQ